VNCRGLDKIPLVQFVLFGVVHRTGGYNRPCGARWNTRNTIGFPRSIQQLRHCASIRFHHRISDHLETETCNILKEQYELQNNQNCKPQNVQKVNTGSFRSNSGEILLSNCKNQSIIWIYSWTYWAMRWHPAKFSSVESIQWNCTWTDSFGWLITRTIIWANVRFKPRSGPEVKVQTGFYHTLPVWKMNCADAVQL